jgi:hypothetical protein
VITFISDLATGRWFSPGPLLSSINKTDRRHDIAEILLKVALNTIKQRNIKQTKQMVVNNNNIALVQKQREMKT